MVDTPLSQPKVKIVEKPVSVVKEKSGEKYHFDEENFRKKMKWAREHPWPQPSLPEWMTGEDLSEREACVNYGLEDPDSIMNEKDSEIFSVSTDYVSFTL